MQPECAILFIRSKQTYRDKDRLDIQMLLAKSPNQPQQAELPPQQKSKGCLLLGLILWIGIGITNWLYEACVG
jgi:hypothetical protein